MTENSIGDTTVQKSPFPEEVLQSVAHTATRVRLPSRGPAKPPQPQAIIAPTGIHNGKFSFTAPAKLVTNVYDACQLAAGMIPDCPTLSKKSVISSSIHNLRATLLTEAKALYRTF